MLNSLKEITTIGGHKTSPSQLDKNQMLQFLEGNITGLLEGEK